MGTFSVPNTFTNGATADAAQVNANFQALVTEGNSLTAAQMTPGTIADATFGGPEKYTFENGLDVNGTLTAKNGLAVTGGVTASAGITGSSGTLPAGMKLFVLASVSASYVGGVCSGNGGNACHTLTLAVPGGTFSAAPVLAIATAESTYAANPTVISGKLMYRPDLSTATSVVFNIDEPWVSPDTVVVSGLLMGAA
jgi:hypothetical protein